MSFSSMVVDRAFFVRWRKLEAGDLDAVLRDVVEARREIGQPLIYVSVTPEDHPVPGPAEREALSRFAAEAKNHCEVSYLVFEGDSMMHRVQRTALTSMMFLLQRDKFSGMHIHKDFETVLRLVAPAINRRVEDLVRLLRARGILPAELAVARQ